MIDWYWLGVGFSLTIGVMAAVILSAFVGLVGLLIFTAIADRM